MRLISGSVNDYTVKMKHTTYVPLSNQKYNVYSIHVKKIVMEIMWLLCGFFPIAPTPAGSRRTTPLTTRTIDTCVSVTFGDFHGVQSEKKAKQNSLNPLHTPQRQLRMAVSLSAGDLPLRWPPVCGNRCQPRST